MALMNALYTNLGSTYQNYFCPTLTLLVRTPVNSKYRKRYEPPKTPYQRLLESDHISTEDKEQLRWHPAITWPVRNQTHHRMRTSGHL